MGFYVSWPLAGFYCKISVIYFDSPSERINARRIMMKHGKNQKKSQTFFLNITVSVIFICYNASNKARRARPWTQVSVGFESCKPCWNVKKSLWKPLLSCCDGCRRFGKTVLPEKVRYDSERLLYKNRNTGISHDAEHDWWVLFP